MAEACRRSPTAGLFRAVLQAVYSAGVTAEMSDAGVRAANAQFYDALERADMEQMIDIWVNTDDAVCAHPGRTPLRGWAEVRASWEAILGFGGNPQVIITEEEVTLRGAVAWVTAIENMISGGHTGAATALNVFEHDGDRWRMVVHHAAPVLG